MAQPTSIVSVVGTTVTLGPRYSLALEHALLAHAGQVRKGTSIPYYAHVMSVSALVLEHGGDEDEAIAALLHDVAEDSGNGDEQLRMIKRLFGKRVRNIVRDCSDTTQQPKPPWLDRKRTYIAHVRSEAAEANTGYLRVALADKVHNAQAIVADVAREGEPLYDRFKAAGTDRADRKRHTIAYYHALDRAFGAYTGDDPGITDLQQRLHVVVATLGTPDEGALRELGIV